MRHARDPLSDGPPRRSCLPLWLAALCLLTATTQAIADKRVALVLGNGAYQSAPRLANALRDARAMRQLLGRLDFEVVYGEDVDKRAMEQAIGRFALAAKEADVALIYYAGHGATFEERPYLVPTDAPFKSLEAIPYELVPIETVLNELRRAKGLRVALFDACRDNEAELALKRKATRGLGVTRGLARPHAPSGIIVAYATQYKATALDGAVGSNSPFTSAVLKHLPTPGQDINTTLRYIGREVTEITNGDQIPAIDSSYFHDYFLVPKSLGAGAGNAPSVNAAIALPPAVAAPPPAPKVAPLTTSDGIRPSPGPSSERVPISPPAPRADQAILAKACDDLAGAPEDLDRNPASTGVAFAALDGRAAVKACRTAVEADPTNRRLQFQYARASQAAKDFKQAKLYYEQASRSGSATSYNNLGAMYEDGIGVPRNYSLALTNFVQSAKLGLARSMLNVGNMYGAGKGVQQNSSEALRWYLQAAQSGNADGMANAGHAYLNGHGTPQNYSEARRWLERAAVLESRDAFNTLGMMHEHGRGVPIDYVEARHWYEKAASRDHMSANFFVGHLYEEGLGVQRNYETARLWLRKAAKLGHPQATFMIGTHYELGLGVPIDYAEARRWYERAAGMKEPHAMFCLGKLYAQGMGVPQSDAQATHWFEQAKALGHEQAKQILARR